MHRLWNFFAKLFAKPEGRYVCRSCGERAADAPDKPCITCDMTVL